ncbi:5-formyltetrahydrofolate cyclo-ligase [Massilia sp. S19_KUP03_FR1]|uniref:5-formyltetrahydrofolate cyclo-ligase n=1 Tax=Massilia sp. S19_KUP03_FR1 TaxID=3025503 RepID=UPI002FCD965A
MNRDDQDTAALAKQALRLALRQARAAVAPATRVQWDATIGAQLLAWWRLRQFPAIGVYWPLAGEPDLRAAYAELADAGVRLALPVVLARDHALAFAEWTPGEAMAKDLMGMTVPARLRMLERPPALVIPCLGYSDEGYRVGYGGGFYDRTLADAIRPATVGVAYSGQRAVFSPAPFDVALDVIFTEKT